MNIVLVIPSIVLIASSAYLYLSGRYLYSALLSGSGLALFILGLLV